MLELYEVPPRVVPHLSLLLPLPFSTSLWLVPNDKKA